jgi:DNA-directed RNA polymerase subunit E'/Rpb7
MPEIVPQRWIGKNRMRKLTIGKRVRNKITRKRMARAIPLKEKAERHKTSIQVLGCRATMWRWHMIRVERRAAAPPDR